MRRLLVLLLAVLGCWLGLVSAASAYAASASDVSAFSYNAPSSDAPENRAAPERGPPSTDPVNTTYVAVDLRSPGTSARQGGPGSRAIYAYDGTALRVQGGTVAGTTTIRPVNARSGDLSSFEQWRVAAEDEGGGWLASRLAMRNERGSIGLPGRGGNPLTTAQATQMANRVGYQPINQTLRGQRVFSNGKNFIVQDIDSHSGGLWKMADTIKALGSKTTRTGTYDFDLNYIGP